MFTKISHNKRLVFDQCLAAKERLQVLPGVREVVVQRSASVHNVYDCVGVAQVIAPLNPTLRGNFGYLAFVSPFKTFINILNLSE